ncbi:fumarylacetoacetase [Actinoplanes sp. SE50]|uniref:fumarylacetoacetase n=1 Tax=unclassified Actinoplanes TaxID=2626549 RepID=UPI00023EC077|nr:MULTISPECIES: fumarylacetoacetase [unclassified Actinoplanes]AEV82969.1 fumarylacetoacetase [Actinoplanes sp. SE50/110]ATO81365.1 fumarylacetoacetase [Actinoplanes sp. SE50]SLL98772.1 fumarylacetoacetase [Actinoplanes sp. SE50/110]
MTWLHLPEATGFGLTNLPYGIFSTPAGTAAGSPTAPGAAPRPADTPRPAGSAAPVPGARTGVAIGDHVLDLAGLTGDPVHATGSLNAFMAQGPDTWAALRSMITTWLTDPAHQERVTPHLVPRDGVTMHLPFEVADYVDFYSSRDHAENLGRMFRPGSPALTPNWTHLPIGYHGRAGTVQLSGTPVTRPQGQSLVDGTPALGPSRRLDIEAEVGFVVGTPSPLGTPVPLSDFPAHVFGVCLVNDWSARDLQSWEYVPLGPFLGKSFLTSISPWVVPLAALSAARVKAPTRDEPLLPYLDDSAEPWGLDLTLEVRLNGHVISRPPFAGMYWTPAQQLAHMTINGASLRTGDLYASGTISGPTRDQRGSLIELSWNASDPLTLPDGSTRSFLEDGDEITITATAPSPDGSRLSFGTVTGRVLPAR